MGDRALSSRRSRYLVFLLLLTSCGSAPSAATTPEIVIDRFMQAWNSHDMSGICRVFAEDADWVSVNGSRVKGCEEIQSLLGKEHAAWARTTTIAKTSSSIKFLSRDAALVHLHWEMTGAPARAGAPVGPLRGVTLFATAKRGANWVVVAGQVTGSRAQ